jgi:U3 small nucleolar RNA-associated protein 4
MVSGDQEGAVQFWDSRFGTLLTRHQQFAADVLTLAASPDGKSVWASGVDPKVCVDR